MDCSIAAVGILAGAFLKDFHKSSGAAEEGTCTDLSNKDFERALGPN